MPEMRPADLGMKAQPNKRFQTDALRAPLKRWALGLLKLEIGANDAFSWNKRG